MILQFYEYDVIQSDHYDGGYGSVSLAWYPQQQESSVSIT